ncbi:FAD-dependent oxidoreductase [Variovorax sp. J22P168]|uniref:FAD-dependent oxidoreductase n=1 Tax=Variovorax jilinensis TaxID=3053513 RepID=UPI0025771AAF|nr:FAD-dependent oxidoreductase [Variovorax sp. J22P168]MDM0010949.1 FAD-dependent oxidoreductase [Variovorax sp. J22P168]
MRVLVLGAGLLGVASAYYLQQLGHEVTVVDRHAMPAARARGIADQPPTGMPARRPLSPSKRIARRWTGAYVLARRRVARLLDRALGAPPRPVPLDHLVRLGAYSRQNVRALRDEAGLPPGHGPRVPPLLNLFTCPDSFGRRVSGAPHWSGLGCEETLLSADEAIAMEPALRALRGRLVGASCAAEDPTRDPASFAASLVFLCRAAGVRFLPRHTVVGLAQRDGRVEHVDVLDAAGEPQRMRAQAYVLALGASSAPHARELGIRMSMRSLREYIVTMPLLDPERAPRATLRDLQGRLRIARIETPAGDRLRVSATVQAGPEETLEPDSERFEAILRRTELLLPGAADTTAAELDTALHAVSTSGLPIIGKTRLPNLFLNVAPGSRSWIHACGAGKSIARIVSGLRPELDFAFRRP